MIFEDATGVRWRWSKWIAGILCAIVIALVADFIASVLVRPALPRLNLAAPSHAVNWAEIPTEAPSAPDAPRAAPDAPAPASSLWGDRKFLRTAFVIQEAPRSVADLRNNLANLDVVFPNWYAWTSPERGLRENIDPALARLLSSRRVATLPLVSNADSQGAWHGKELGRLLRDSTGADLLIQQLAGRITAARADGVNIDFEDLAPDDRAPYADWLRRLATELHRRHLFLTVDVPLEDEAFDYAAIGAVADAVVAMAYDQHYAAGAPGPVAGARWSEEGIARVAEEVPPAKLIVAIGAFGYDWDVTANTPAKALSFSDLMLLADRTDAVVETDKASLNSRFHYRETDGDEHEVWFLDAVTAWNQFLAMQKSEVGGFSVWRLGMEEPGIWSFLNCDPPESFRPETLSSVKTSQSVMIQGRGEVYRVLDASEDGRRELTFDGKSIDYAGYVQLPHYALVEQQGHNDAKRIALTFDDGPDPTWTPQVLDILRDNGVRGTFFLVGDRAQISPGLVREEYAEGHLLGNHTFSHPHLGHVSDARLDFEMDATQRVIESITGHQTLLFRSPFDTDTTPLSSEQFVPLRKACERGYYLVGADVDSVDTERPGTDQVVRNVLDGLSRTGGNIVVFHDAGTDRRQTIDALKVLVPRLKQDGYTFVTVDELLGVQKSAIMPAAPARDVVFTAGGQGLAWLRGWVWPGVIGLLLLASCLAVIRVTGLGVLIAHSALRKPAMPAEPFTPPIAVVIPAFNEAKVIRRTLEALLDSDYPRLRAIVIDDGSTDDTARIVLDMAALDERVNLISKRNAGKWAALNLAFEELSEDVIVTIDADTIVLPETIRHLVAPLVDPRVDAVCGNVQVGNVNRLLTTFQDVEYVTTQNYDRRAFEALNCITVVPGATGAWRREAVLRVGGYSRQTLTEDADLTITLLREGGRIVYAPLARSVTEAPEHLGPLFRQRFRWTFGMLQCLWKHRGAFGRGWLGWIALPNILGQLLFQLLGPLCDLLLVISLLRGQLGSAARAYLVFLTLDMVASVIAFALERRRSWSLLVVPLQRFLYRPFLYYVAAHSLIAIFRGGRHGWNKLERTGALDAVTPRPPRALAPAA